MEDLNYEIEKKNEDSLQKRLLSYEEKFESVCENNNLGDEETC